MGLLQRAMTVVRDPQVFIDRLVPPRPVPKVVKSEALNRLGLQPLRASAAQALYGLRAWQGAGPEDPVLDAIALNGLAMMENFLPQDIFARVCREYEGGFDDRALVVDRGSHIMQVVTIPPNGTDPQFATIQEHLLREPRLLNLIARAARKRRIFPQEGMLQRVTANEQYDPNNGETDPDAFLHQDVFYPDWKVWFCIKPMTVQNGAFRFAKGTHRFGLSRLAFEYRQSVHNLGGSWKVSDEDKVTLGVKDEPVCCRENTLVIANTHGFHARGHIEPGQRRETIHIIYRVNPWCIS